MTGFPDCAKFRRLPKDDIVILIEAKNLNYLDSFMASTRKRTRIRRTYKRTEHAKNRSKKVRAKLRKLKREGAITLRPAQ